MRVEDFDYDLPVERIALRPLTERSSSRLMVLDRRDGSLDHRRFEELPRWLRAGDLLICNDSKVLRARLRGEREGGGEVEILLVGCERRAAGEEIWTCLARPGRRLPAGARAHFPGALVGEWLGEADAHGLRRVRLRAPRPVLDVLEEFGEVPLPPYLDREADEADSTAYQTVYARSPGAVAAPTAGLHFTTELLDRLRADGVEVRSLTLHVGPGTFLPVRTSLVAEHCMLPEAVEIPPETARAVARAKQAGRRVLAVGTTTVRALEGGLQAGTERGVRAEVSLFIQPGYRFRWVDALITNFHLPRSTLIMLVAAFAGRERVLQAYGEAIARGYRFYSYGDAMLVL